MRAPSWLKIVIALVVAATLLRFIGLSESPPGFYIDEAAISAQAICLRQSGHDVFNRTMPLFSPVLGGGYVTPPYLYSAAAWSSVFGDEISSFRALAAFYGALLIAGVFFLARLLFIHREAAWLCALCAALSPWGFAFSRIAWDPPLAPAFFVWSLYFFLRQGRHPLITSALAGLLGALACYAYPPLRVQSILVVPLFALVFAPDLSRKAVLSFVIAFAVAALPLVHLTLTGEIQGRFNMLSIFSESYLQQFGGFSIGLVIKIFLGNIASLLSPGYLFLHGDANLRHSTQAVGLWSWLEIAALLSAVILALTRKLYSTARERNLLGLLAACYIAGIIPAALTWESNPHSLRSIGALPFLSLLAGFVLLKAVSAWRRAMPGLLVIAIGFSGYFFYDYFQLYPVRSAIWFDQMIVHVAAKLKTEGRSGEIGPEVAGLQIPYDDLALLYYRLRDGAESCR